MDQMSNWEELLREA